MAVGLVADESALCELKPAADVAESAMAGATTGKVAAESLAELAAGNLGTAAIKAFARLLPMSHAGACRHQDATKHFRNAVDAQRHRV